MPDASTASSHSKSKARWKFWARSPVTMANIENHGKHQHVVKKPTIETSKRVKTRATSRSIDSSTSNSTDSTASNPLDLSIDVSVGNIDDKSQKSLNVNTLEPNSSFTSDPVPTEILQGESNEKNEFTSQASETELNSESPLLQDTNVQVSSIMVSELDLEVRDFGLKESQPKDNSEDSGNELKIPLQQQSSVEDTKPSVEVETVVDEFDDDNDDEISVEDTNMDVDEMGLDKMKDSREVFHAVDAAVMTQSNVLAQSDEQKVLQYFWAAVTTATILGLFVNRGKFIKK